MAIAPAVEEMSQNPLDRIERLAEARSWILDRATPHEVTLLLEGAWGNLHMSMDWRGDLETLHVACTFDSKVPAPRMEEAQRLVALVNTQLMHGHFDLWTDDGSLVYRNNLILAGGALANDAQCEALMRVAADTCQRYFPAIQFVVWAGRTAEDAIESCMFDTMGEA